MSKENAVQLMNKLLENKRVLQILDTKVNKIMVVYGGIVKVEHVTMVFVITHHHVILLIMDYLMKQKNM